MFIVSNSFLVESLGFSTYKIMSSAKVTLLLFHSQFGCLLSFSCLTALARNYRTMLNKRGKSEHPCFVPDFRGKAFSFSTLSILANGLS